MVALFLFLKGMTGAFALAPLSYLVLDMSFQSCIYIGVIFCDEVGENAVNTDSRCTCLGSLIDATTISNNPICCHAAQGAKASKAMPHSYSCW